MLARVVAALLLLAFLPAHSANSGAAATTPLTPRQRDLAVATALRSEGQCLRAAHVVVCAQRGALSDAQLGGFLATAEQGAQAVRRWLGAQLDLPGGNQRDVEFFIGREVGIPHVTILDEPWIFMHPEVIERGMAPYLHEMVHAMAQWSWRNSEWVAEGFANHAAAAVAAEYGGYHRSFILPDGLVPLHTLYRSPEGQAMLPLIGLAGRRHRYQGEAAELAARLRSARRRYAPAYYAMSWSFVDYLVARIGYPGLRELAQSDAPSQVLQRLTGHDMAFHLGTWQEAVIDGKPDR